jgi:hypothetical protein
MSDKSNYNLKEMMKVAQDLRSTGTSSRSGKKLRRRSSQSSRGNSTARNVIYTILTILIIAAVIATTWFMSRHQKGQSVIPGFEAPGLEMPK